MRVIAGSARGIRLNPVPGTQTRPISDRVKQSLFDILSDRLAGARVLDLFAGSGSVGIEALSRGASSAVFVERHHQAIRTIHANLERTHLANRGRVVRSDVFQFLSRHAEPHDLVYVAPPQYQGLWATTLRALDDCPGWLSSGGLIIVQIFPKEFEKLAMSFLELTDQRRIGSTSLLFYEPSAGSEPPVPDAPQSTQL